jgi:polar amino acid transport system substrate-binding protein
MMITPTNRRSLIRIGIGIGTMLGTRSARADLADVKSRGILQIGTSGKFPPYSGIAPNGDSIGFDIDYLSAIARKLGVTARVATLDSSGVFPGLLARRFDTACAAFVMTEDRLKAVDFTRPYMFGATVMLVRKSDALFKSYADLKGRRIGVILGSVDERRLRTSVQGWGELKTYPGWSEQWTDLLAGRVDGLSTQYAVAMASMKHERDASEVTIAGDPVFKSVLGFPVRKTDTALRDAMSAAIVELESDGLTQELSRKWLGFEVTPQQIHDVWASQNYLGRS